MIFPDFRDNETFSSFVEKNRQLINNTRHKCGCVKLGTTLKIGLKET